MLLDRTLRALRVLFLRMMNCINKHDIYNINCQEKKPIDGINDSIYNFHIQVQTSLDL